MLNRFLKNSGPASPFEALESRSMLAADMLLTVGGLTSTFDSTNQPIIKLPVQVRNVGNTILQGGGRIEYYLSADRTLSDSDFLFRTDNMPAVGGAGSTGNALLNTALTGNIAPPVGRAVPEGQYFIIAKLVPAVASREPNISNNVAATTTKATVSYSFGTVGTRARVPLSVTLADGDRVTFAIDGPGVGRVLNVDNRIVVTVSGTTNQTILRMLPAVSGHTPTINSLTINGFIKSVYAAGVNVDGNVSLNGGTTSVTLGDVSHSTFRILGQSSGIVATFGNVLDTSMTFPSLVKVSVKSWRDTNSTRDVLTAPVIDTLLSGGNFGAAVVTTNELNGYSLRRVDIVGDLTTGAWNIASNISIFNVRNINSTWGGTIRGVVDNFNVSGKLSGTIGIGSVRRLIVYGDVFAANVLIGANLGADGRLGGTGVNADQFNGGRIGVLEVRGSINGSTIAAGLSTFNATIGDADDRLLTGAGVQIDSILVIRTVTNSRIMAATLPTTASINHLNVTTATTPSIFRTSLP